MTAPFLEIVYRFQALACGLGQDASPVHRDRANAVENAKARCGSVALDHCGDVDPRGI